MILNSFLGVAKGKRDKLCILNFSPCVYTEVSAQPDIFDTGELISKCVDFLGSCVLSDVKELTSECVEFSSSCVFSNVGELISK